MLLLQYGFTDLMTLGESLLSKIQVTIVYHSSVTHLAVPYPLIYRPYSGVS